MASGKIAKAKIEGIQIFRNTALETGVNNYACDWSDYDILSFYFSYYGNPLTGITISKEYFNGTSPNKLIRVFQPGSATIRIDVYKNDNNNIYINPVDVPANNGLIIVGFRVA